MYLVNYRLDLSQQRSQSESLYWGKNFGLNYYQPWSSIEVVELKSRGVLSVWQYGLFSVLKPVFLQEFGLEIFLQDLNFVFYFCLIVPSKIITFHPFKVTMN